MYKIKPAITCSKLAIEKLEEGVKYDFIVNFEHISHLVLVFLLLTYCLTTCRFGYIY